MRYAVAGFCVTQFAAAIYSALVFFLTFDPLKANALSTVCGLCAGYLAHSRWSFAVGSSDREHMQVGRFLLASLLAFLINSAWIWLLVGVMHLSPLAPVPLMMLATPCISFLLNRYWVFRAY
ncbi:MAG: GtrA family protein [Pseudomonadota bacterium]|nr:GtrA family protein [Pseudomonadota bacterium]